MYFSIVGEHLARTLAWFSLAVSLVVIDCFSRAAKHRGIMVPILPGLMCINAWGGFKKMTGFCRTRVPAELMAKMESIKVSVLITLFGYDGPCGAAFILCPSFFFQILMCYRVALAHPLVRRNIYRRISS